MKRCRETPEPQDAIRALAFQASPTATVVLDEHGRIVAANPAYARLGGHHEAECLGTPPRVHGARGNAALAQLLASGADPATGCEAVLEHADGSGRRVWMRWTRVVEGPCGERLHVATFSELQLDEEVRWWRHRAHHDALTGLPNRDHLAVELDRGIARAARHRHRLALLFVDLDGFKSVNDRLGHASGDRVLTQVAMRLREALRAEDFVARLGGDEFVALLEAPHEVADAVTAAEKLLHALGGGPDLAGGGWPSVTASIGIAVYPDHAADAQELLRVADAAMYRAKRSGGNLVAIADAPVVGRPRRQQAA